MTTAKKTSMLHNSKEEGSVTEPDKGGNIVYEIPVGEENAIVCKFVRSPFTGESCLKIRYWPHAIGNNDSDRRFHPCAKSLGEDESPELEYQQSLIEQLSAMKKEGKQETKEYKRIQTILKNFKPRNGGYLFFVGPNSSQLKALKCSAMIFNRLFGRKATEYRKAVPSLVQEAQQKGVSPYVDVDPELNKTGWVKVWKTGEKLSTEYHLELLATTEDKVIDGERMTISKLGVRELDPAFLEFCADPDFTKIPDPIGAEKKNMWTKEESENFVAHEGKLSGVPERLLKENQEQKSAQDQVAEVHGQDYNSEDESDGNAVQIDEIPFD